MFFLYCPNSAPRRGIAALQAITDIFNYLILFFTLDSHFQLSIIHYQLSRDISKNRLLQHNFQNQ